MDPPYEKRRLIDHAYVNGTINNEIWDSAEYSEYYKLGELQTKRQPPDVPDASYSVGRPAASPHRQSEYHTT